MVVLNIYLSTVATKHTLTQTRKKRATKVNSFLAIVAL